jgi:hypothetical protein
MRPRLHLLIALICAALSVVDPSTTRPAAPLEPGSSQGAREPLIYAEITLVRVGPRADDVEGAAGHELGALRPLRGPVAEQLLPSSFAEQETDAVPFLMFALEELRASRTVGVVATPSMLVASDRQRTFVFDPACELGPRTEMGGLASLSLCVARKRDRSWPYAPLHLAVAARAIGPARALVSVTLISAGARGPTQPIELEVSGGIPNLLWMPESPSTEASDIDVAADTAQMRGVLVIVTASIIESQDDLRQLSIRRQSDKWAGAVARLSVRGLATLSMPWLTWHDRRERAVAGEMSFACRRGPIHDFFHRVPRRVKTGTAAFPTLPLYCSSGLPWEGAALGAVVTACKDGELQTRPMGPGSDDAPCLGHRPDGSLYQTTFGAARATQGGR